MVELHPEIHAQVAALKDFKEVDFRVEDIRKGSEQADHADRFTLVIPCCLERLRWHVVYNVAHLGLPPDIIFPLDDASFQPLVAPAGDAAGGPPEGARGQWSLLRDWSTGDRNRLLRLVLDLRMQYMKHQRRLVEAVDDLRIRFEISTLSNLKGLEMCLVPSLEKPEEVQMEVPLTGVDIVPLATILGGSLGRTLLSELQGPGAAHLHLLVRFVLARPGQKAPPPQLRLLAPQRVLEAFALVDSKMPGWTDSTCLMEYVPVLQQQLQEQVQEAKQAVELRKAFISALLPCFGRPLEADLVNFRHVSVFLTSGTLMFLVHFYLPITFPKQQPSLVLQSTQHFDTQGRPIASRPYGDFPWSPRWEAGEMARRICDFIVSETTNFRRLCVESLQRK